MRNEKGFTMIELVMVIVLLGILAAVAIPRYVDMQTEARRAAANGVLGAVRATGAINHAAYQLGQTPGLITTGTTLVARMEGGLPSGWFTDDTGGAGVVGICTGGTSATDACTDAGSVYNIKIDTIQTATVAPAFGTGGTGTW